MKTNKLVQFRRRAGRWSALFATATLITAVCAVGSSGGVAASASTSKVSCPVRILDITNLTGAGAASGVGNEEAVKIALKAVNARGGILGCKVVADIKDEESNPTLDIGILEKAESEYSYPEILDESFGGGTIESYTAAHHLLNIQPNGGNGLGDPSQYPYYFDTNPWTTWTDDALIKIAHTKGYDKIAVIADNTSQGVGEIQDVTAALKSDGGTLTAAVQVPDAIINATPAVLQAQASNPQALYVGLYGPANGEILKAISAAGWNIPILGSFYTKNTPITTLAPAADYQNMEGITPASQIVPGNAPIKSLISSLKKDGVTINTGIASYSEASDAVYIFAYGANGAKSLNPAKIAAFLDKTGNKPVPGLSTITTGYTSSSHYWKPKMALSKIAPFPPNDGLSPAAG